MSSTPSTPFDRALTVPARVDQLRRVIAFVSQQAKTTGFSGKQLNSIELAVDEACSNIILHGYAGRDDGEIHIATHAEPGRRIVITLRDTGNPFDPATIPEHNPRAALDDLREGGLGIFLIRQSMDEVRFEFGLVGEHADEPPRYNRLTLTKHLKV